MVKIYGQRRGFPARFLGKKVVGKIISQPYPGAVPDTKFLRHLENQVRHLRGAVEKRKYRSRAPQIFSSSDIKIAS